MYLIVECKVGEEGMKRANLEGKLWRHPICFCEAHSHIELMISTQMPLVWARRSEWEQEWKRNVNKQTISRWPALAPSLLHLIWSLKNQVLCQKKSGVTPPPHPPSKHTLHMCYAHLLATRIKPMNEWTSSSQRNAAVTSPLHTIAFFPLCAFWCSAQEQPRRTWSAMQRYWAV